MSEDGTDRTADTVRYYTVVPVRVAVPPSALLQVTTPGRSTRRDENAQVPVPGGFADIALVVAAPSPGCITCISTLESTK